MPSIPVYRRQLIWLTILLLSTSSSAGEARSTAETCTLFMAPSTIPNAGIGVFTAVDIKEGENVGYPDLAIPVTDVDWHNGGSRQVSGGWSF